MKKAKWLKANCDVVEVTPKNGRDFQYEELRKFVGGFIEIVHINDKQIMVVNEEGKLNGLPYNSLATEALILAHQGHPVDYIVGDVLLCDNDMVK